MDSHDIPIAVEVLHEQSGVARNLLQFSDVLRVPSQDIINSVIPRFRRGDLTTYEAIHEVLTKWRHSSELGATREALYTALENIGERNASGILRAKLELVTHLHVLDTLLTAPLSEVSLPRFLDSWDFIISSNSLESAHLEKYSYLACQAVGPMVKKRLFEQALNFCDRSLDVIQTKLGANSPAYLRVKDASARIYYRQDMADKAVEIDEFVYMAQCESKVLGPNHPETLVTAHNLSVYYWECGRYEEAVKLGKKTLVARKQVMGKNDPSTLATLKVYQMYKKQMSCMK